MLIVRALSAKACVPVGGGSAGGHVVHHSHPAAFPAHGATAGAAGVRSARGVCGDAQKGGALPRHHRQPPAHWLAVAEPGGVHQ